MKQAEKIFMISDAAKQVKVEAHVLRYWEEELELPVKRNEMGHRFYTEEDLEMFRRIKELKEKGIQLKGIKTILKNGGLMEPEGLLEREDRGETNELEKRHVVMVKKGEFLPVTEKTFPIREESREQKSLRLQQLLKEMISEAVASNNQEIYRDMKESILKEMDYQFRLQEEREETREKERMQREEEHFKQIDELLRTRSVKKEAAPKRKKIFEGKLLNGFTGKKRSIT
ncbi:MAG: helix-turn-helix domain-containing protein [Lachnospiraceae bacterium]|nr:helix-turn-helix domain-containing protein [Lachnospiraceae bacterium]